jgi:NitT/TauT family transport system substrate-binding protein
MKPWTFAAYAVALVATALVSTSAQAQGKGETLRLQDYPGTGNLLARVAIKKGYCEKAGIKCELQQIPSGPLGAQALLAKSIDVGFFPPEVQVGAIQKGAKIRAVVGGASSNVFIWIAGNHIDTPNAGKPFPAFMGDLKGKKVGVPARNSGAEIMFTHMLGKAGMKAEDVTFVAVGAPNTAYGALVSKQVDALATFEPAGTLCDMTKQCKVLWRGAQDKEPAELYALNGGGSPLIMRDEQLTAAPHVADALIAAIKEADTFINNPANKEELFQITTSYFKLDMPNGEAIMRTLLQRTLDAKTYVAPISRTALQNAINYLAQTKQIEKAVSTQDLLYPKAP